jgi:predicted patatin/cPLA2 family phospholipase
MADDANVAQTAPAAPAKRRALILAGGGLKVAFQAGVLQVWLDEANITFDLADGASGGCFNLAMYCQGMSGTQIADNWRALEPAAGASLNLAQFPRLLFARSLFTLDAYRSKVFPQWGLDWNKIRASSRQATFNVFNFTRQRLETIEPAARDEDRLCASVSLPMWFPPVVLDGQTYIDAVYVTDANIEEAIRRGADEIWVIWTVSTRGEWADGFVNNYFQIIEAAANGRFQQIRDRIEANNSALAAGGTGEYGRPITLRVLSAEVGLNYLMNFTSDRVIEAVNQGVEAARRWCKAEGIALGAPAPITSPPADAPVSLQFSEVMKGYITNGEPDYDKGYRTGAAAGTPLVAELTIRTDDVNRFITAPQHEATVTGSVRSPLYGGGRPITAGVFNLLVDTENPERKAMYYRLHFTDSQGSPLTLLGYKDIRDDDGSDLWTDTTTLFTRILRGHVHVQDDGGEQVLAAGIIRVHMLDFLHELTTFRLAGATAPQRAGALTRFGVLFMGKLWDVYAHQILPESPV